MRASPIISALDRALLAQYSSFRATSTPRQRASHTLPNCPRPSSTTCSRQEQHALLLRSRNRGAFPSHVMTSAKLFTRDHREDHAVPTQHAFSVSMKCTAPSFLGSHSGREGTVHCPLRVQHLGCPPIARRASVCAQRRAPCGGRRRGSVAGKRGCPEAHPRSRASPLGSSTPPLSARCRPPPCCHARSRPILTLHSFGCFPRPPCQPSDRAEHLIKQAWCRPSLWDKR